MSGSVIEEWLISSLTWQAFWYAIKSFVFAVIATTVVKKALGALKERKQPLIFCGGTFVLAWIALSVIGNAADHSAVLEARINGIGYGGHSDDGRLKSPVIVNVSIVNSGTAPSIARDWSLTVDLDGRAMVADHYFHIGTPMRMRTGSGSETLIDPEDSLDEKAFKKPIAPGEGISGFLLFAFPTMGEDAFKEKLRKVTLKFSDVKAHNSSATYVATGQETSDAVFIPGMKEGVQCIPAR